MSNKLIFIVIVINTCKNILRVKLLSVNSTFAANYQYLSYKYGLIEADWFTPLGHLLGKVKKKILLLHPHPVLCGILKELCGIRDNTSLCDIANNNDIQYRSASLSINPASRAGACTDCEYIECTTAIIIIVILVRSLFLVDIMCSFG